MSDQPAFSALETIGILTMLILGLACVVTFADTKCPPGPQQFHVVQYLNNYDGDTFRAHIPNVHPVLEEAGVRIFGIDAPEMDGTAPCEKEKAIAAKDFVSARLKKARRIDLTIRGRDKYFRLLADVIADGKSLGPLVVKQGLAVPYDGGTKPTTNWCEVKKK